MSLLNAQFSISSKMQLLLALDQLHDIYNALAPAGVDWVLVKGIGLALWAWPDPFARPFSDLDIFVRPKGFGIAVKALLDLGYRPGDTENDYVSKHWRLYSKGRFPVELHYDFTREWTLPRFLLDSFCDEAMYVDAGGWLLPLPSPGRHLAFVLLHAYNHGFMLNDFWRDDVHWILTREPDALQQAVNFFPYSWPVRLSIAVAAAQDARICSDSLSTSTRLAGQFIARAIQLNSSVVPRAVLSAFFRVVGSSHPFETLARMAARFDAHSSPVAHIFKKRG